MKKRLLKLTGGLVLMFFIFFSAYPSKSYAQGLESGTSCCRGGFVYEPSTDQCVSVAAGFTCSQIGATCDFAIQYPLYGTSVPGTNMGPPKITLSDVIPNCSNSLENACNVTFSSGTSGARTGAQLCDNLGDNLSVSMVLTNPFLVTLTTFGMICDKSGLDDFLEDTVDQVNEETQCSSAEKCQGGVCVSKDKLVKFNLCLQIPESSPSRASCTSCAERGVWTAVGCIPTTPSSIISKVMTVGLSLAGAFSFLVLIASGASLTFSQGDIKAVGEAKERAVAAVVGLLFIIFSVTLLEFIGYNILRIPGFGG